MRARSLSVAIVVLAFGLVGCKQKGSTDPSGKVDPAAKPEPQAAAGAFAWSAAPTLDMIPAGPVKGEAQGKPFEAKAIYFEPGFKEWQLVVHEGQLSSPTGISPSGQSINISLPEDPAAGKKWTRAMKYGDGYFQISKPDDPKNTTSWNTDNAWAIEITKWAAKPYDLKGSIFQEAGKASGRIAVCYKGAGDFKNSYAAGTFTDVVVRYMGKPYWLKKEEKKEDKK